MPRKTSSPVASIPPELWLYIHRLATLDASPLVIACKDISRYRYAAAVDDPLGVKKLQRFLQAARSLALVCRSWNGLAKDILYENIKVDSRSEALSKALENPVTAVLVRTIRLSTTRFDRNAHILNQCPMVEIIVQPEFPRSERLYTVTDTTISSLLLLKQLYWTETAWSSGLLRSVLQASPNLEHVCLSSSASIASEIDVSHFFPPLPKLSTISVAQLSQAWTLAILDEYAPQLTRLIIRPDQFSWQGFPVLPALTTLELFGSTTTIPFPTILTRCPNLRDLCYDVRNSIVDPGTLKSASTTCIRLHNLAPQLHRVRWETILGHFSLFLGLSFPQIRRIVLEGTWEEIITDTRFRHELSTLSRRAIQLEFPEGIVL
ncbi:hypothetical protein C8J57DRAFT_1356816 [Mycena rebaudengoi]|nr:hypothetical protein C8J57DRAFT_1356816 [Mycena rebaudengoi]